MARYLLAAAFCLAVTLPMANAEDWPRFLGLKGTSTSPDSTEIPESWSDEENLKWKISLPGRGVSSPIVVGKKVLVTCYSGYGTARDQQIEDLKRHLVCVNRDDGKVIWEKAVNAVMPEDPYSGMGVPSHGYASHTPVSDGKHVFCFFGKSGVVAFDLDGNELWRKSVGTGSGPKRWGSSSSPILYKDSVIVTAADESEAIYAFDKTSGEELWKCEGGFVDTYNTPLIVNAGDRSDLVISVPGEVWGINPETGKLRWYSIGVDDNSASASLAVSDGVVYATGSRSGSAVAVKVGGKGDVNKTHVVWEANIPGRFATPIVHDKHLYSFASGVLTCYNAASGDRVKQLRLSDSGGRGFGGRGSFGGRGGGGGGDYASPILIDGKLIVTEASGSFYVVNATPELELVATNKLTDASGFAGTPAVSDGQIFLRSHENLYCIAK